MEVRSLLSPCLLQLLLRPKRQRKQFNVPSQGQRLAALTSTLMVWVYLHLYSAILVLPEPRHVAEMVHTVLVSTDEEHVRTTVELRCGINSG
jgi:hypothetical protein